MPNIPAANRTPKQGSHSLAPDTAKTPSNSNAESVDTTSEGQDATPASENPPGRGASPTKPAPKSWADLVRSKVPPPTAESRLGDNVPSTHTNGAGKKPASLAEALSSYNVKGMKDSSKISFLEPRGLVNTGNMCYMNSVSLPKVYFVLELIRG